VEESGLTISHTVIQVFGSWYPGMSAKGRPTLESQIANFRFSECLYYCMPGLPILIIEYTADNLYLGYKPDTCNFIPLPFRFLQDRRKN
jgi:hypothetical protein